ncbi:MAG: LysR family transcriptional regulator [Burkholderiaceae bacterium]|nr:LysR family transcriptional regulator [Burkholderiaceae bacterium]
MALIRYTPRQLEAFVAVAKAQGFGEAAARLSLTPSAISQLVAELESAMGLRLFDRTTRRVALSAAGRELLDTAGDALAALQRMQRAADDLRSRTTGVLRVAAPLAIASTVLPEAIEVFAAAHPRVTVHVCDAPVDRLVDAVAQAEADFALGPDRPTGDDVQREPVLDSPWVLWCVPAHPLAQHSSVDWSELRGHALVSAGRDHELSVPRMGLQCPEADRVAPLQVVDHLTTAFGLAASGRAATLAPAYTGRLAQAFGLEARRITGPEVMRQVCLYRPVRRSLPPAADAFAEHLRAWLPDHCIGSTTLTCPVPEAAK